MGVSQARYLGEAIGCLLWYGFIGQTHGLGELEVLHFHCQVGDDRMVRVSGHLGQRDSMEVRTS